MIDLVLEHPWVVLGIGLVFAIASVQVGLQVGRKDLIWASGVIALVAAGLCYAGHAVVTERESVVEMLFKTADALERNDADAVLAAVFPNPTRAVLAGKHNVTFVKFETFRITKIFDIEFTGPETARRAKAAFNIYMQGSFRGMQLKFPRYLEVTLYRYHGKWLIYDFIDSNPLQGFKERLVLEGD